MEPRSPVRLTHLLGPALGAARKALRDLDADQVPASLRRVVAQSGSLTPPFAMALVRALDELPWLRERALEAWPEADAAPSAPDRASALFLRRPVGWEIDLAIAAAEAGAEIALSGSVRSDRERAGVERDLAASREREQALRRRLDAADAEVRELKRRISEPLRTGRSGEERARQAMARAEEAWAAERAGLEAAVAARESDIVMLREELHLARRARAEASRLLDEARGGSTWSDGDPMALAVLVDDLAAQARVARAAPEPVAAVAGGFTLASGIRPDEARALDALVAHRGPLLVAVDGYNAGLGMVAGSPPEVRARLRAVLDRLVVVATPGIRVSVVWDSSIDEARATRKGRLEVRFADAAEEADDVLVALARDSDVPVVVISNDRGVRHRAEAVGAVTLWSDALVRWGAERR